MSARVVPLVEATLPGAVSTPLFGMGGNEDNDPGSRAPASLRPDTRHQVVTNLETLLSTFDKVWSQADVYRKRPRTFWYSESARELLFPHAFLRAAFRTHGRGNVWGTVWDTACF